MRLLIDTQAILWYGSSDSKLPNSIQILIDDPNHQCFVSIASLWEMAIKVSLDKLSVEIGYENFANYLIKNGFEILEIKPPHLTMLLLLPHYHKDPLTVYLFLKRLQKASP